MKKTYLPRILEIEHILKTRSLFLFGPRQTGKSSYISNQLSTKPVLTYNLLDQGFLLKILSDPTLIRQEIEAKDISDAVICIDEIQKCPPLLDEAHLLIESRNIRFLLTGSSARKLKKAGTNLLGGRARDRIMHPFVYPEVRAHGFSLEKMIFHGMLPPHFLSDEPEEDLSAYVNRYLTEEIAAEGLARNLSAFARFLETAATVNTRMINYTNIGNDAQVPRQTVKEWFQILKDTLLGFDLPAYTKTIKRKAIETSKFYFFDPGVVRILRRIPALTFANADFGEFFEQFIFLEIRTWIDWNAPRTLLHYWRSTSGFEVDFLLNESIGIEVKSAEFIQDKHCKGIKALLEEKSVIRAIIVSREKGQRKKDNIEMMHWTIFLELLWDNQLLHSMNEEKRN